METRLILTFCFDRDNLDRFFDPVIEKLETVIDEILNEVLETNANVYL